MTFISTSFQNGTAFPFIWLKTRGLLFGEIAPDKFLIGEQEAQQGGGLKSREWQTGGLREGFKY